MPRYSPRTNVVSYGGTTPTTKRERYVLDEFCKRMRRHHAASYRVVPIPEALRRGLVIDISGATVDGVLRTSKGAVAVELLSYSPWADRGDVMALDFALRKVVKQALYNQLLTNSCSLSIWYGERPRSGRGPAGMVRTVPSTQEFREVVNELRSVVACAPPLGVNQFLSVRFVPPDFAAATDMRRGLYLDATRFPVCAAHITQVLLFGLEPGSVPDVDSELSCGFIGIDEVWVGEQLASKADKSLRKSRERANGLPLWLIVHSDGHAIHQTIAKVHRRGALELCRDVLTETEHGFARVYWADRTGFVNAAWVGRVI